MRTINLETEIVSTRTDPASRIHSYTIERDGRRWTVDIHEDEFNRLNPNGATKEQRRNMLGHRLQVAMLGKADGE